MAGVQRTRKPTTTRIVKPVKGAAKAKARQAAKPAAVAPDPRPVRRIRPPIYKSLRFSRRIRHPVRLPSGRKLAKTARRLVYANWKLIGGIVLTYGVLNFILVHGLNGGTDVRQLKQQLDLLLQGSLGHLAAGFSIFALLVSSSATTGASNNAPVYQSILTLLVSLALVWAYRQLLAGKRIGVRDAYYRGMYPLIPVILVLLVISLELLPMLAGGWLFTTVVQQRIAVTILEKSLWGLLAGLLALLSLYMICSSFFALYIVTLADMTPLKALRSARELVRYRRWTVLRKALFLPLWLAIAGALVMLPFILLVPVLAQWVFFVLAMIGLGVGHAYMYLLYRELLREKN